MKFDEIFPNIWIFGRSMLHHNCTYEISLNTLVSFEDTPVNLEIHVVEPILLSTNTGINKYFSVSNPQKYVYYVHFCIAKYILHMSNILYRKSLDSR